MHCHAVFGTKHREPWLAANIEERVWAYLGGIAKANRIQPLQIGGVDDHVHMLIGLPPTLSMSQAMQLIKGGTSAWIKDSIPGMKGFAWQDGYGAFAVSKSSVPRVATYIRSQREHHKAITFCQEFRALLDRHGIVYDERYVWD
jgi:REP element-mobilizing transposase RayT